MSSQPRFTNRLIGETSPYLLQHAHNPVDWYPWGPDALERAREEDKPILLSIGYSACHWCHVMERESFEDEAIAQLMNNNFVSIKVDREERPDLDSIYMSAVQMMTGHGGWPMTVFLTPNQVPFYGGTYFPPADRHGLPGFPRLLIALSEAYQTKRQEIEKNAEAVLLELRRLSEVKTSDGEISTEILDGATTNLMRAFDPRHGGFGSKPKFPPSMALTFLLRHHRRTKDAAVLAAVELTLDQMAFGGIYDQLGGGFHRYSVDDRWLVPHFEKMLYDNALLSRIYLDAFLVSGKCLYRRIATETLDYVRREMTDQNGAFYSTQDADSEGEEGKFFVWTRAEVEAILGADDSPLFCRYFDISETGNFEGNSILHCDEKLEVVARLMKVEPERLVEAWKRGRALLFEARERRVKPGRDEKVLTAWNGLMMRSFAEAARVLGRVDYREVAVANAKFLLANLYHEGGLLRSFKSDKSGKSGESKLNGYLEDYAYLADGLLALYEATFEVNWFVEAQRLVDKMIEQFWDDGAGGFFFTGRDHEQLISRSKDFYDNAVPAGNSVAVHVLLRLAMFTAESRYREMAVRTLRLLQDYVLRAPSAFGHLLCAFDCALASSVEIAIVGPRESAETGALVETVFQMYQPNRVVASARAGDAIAMREIRLLEGRTEIESRPTAYVCSDFTCEVPVNDPEKLAQQLLES